MGAFSKRTRSRAAGGALALLACLALLLNGVMRVTHHHDGKAAHGAQAQLDADGHSHHGHNDHQDHDDHGCTICQALAATAAVAPISAPPALAPRVAVRQPAEQIVQGQSGPWQRAPWRSRAPPVA